MKLLCLLVIVVVNAAVGDKPNDGPTIEEIRNLIDEMEADLLAMNGEIMESNTLWGVSQERMNSITDSFMSAVTLQNLQQDSLVRDYEAQMKAMQHRADKMEEEMAGAITLANATQAGMGQMNSTMEDQATRSRGHGQALRGLHDSMDKADNQFQQMLADKMADMTGQENTMAAALVTMQGEVESRKCEYGTVSIEVNDTLSTSMMVPFRTTFTTPPVVTLTLTGFASRLHFGPHNDDNLGLDKFVTHVTPEGFNVTTLDLSSGKVFLDGVSCFYVACQGMNAV